MLHVLVSKMFLVKSLRTFLNNQMKIENSFSKRDVVISSLSTEMTSDIFSLTKSCIIRPTCYSYIAQRL